MNHDSVDANEIEVLDSDGMFTSINKAMRTGALAAPARRLVALLKRFDLEALWLNADGRNGTVGGVISYMPNLVLISSVHTQLCPNTFIVILI